MSDSENWTSSDLKKALEKHFADGEAGAVPAAVSAQYADQMDALVRLVIHYDPDAHPSLPDDVTDTVMFKRLKTRLETAAAHDAVKDGNVSSMRYLAGPPQSQRIDAGTFSLLDKVEELFKPGDRDHMLNLVIYAPPPPTGPTGVGKTDFAYSLIEGAELVHDGDLTVASNNTSDPFEDVQSWTELEEWLETTAGTKLFLWDEAAQTLMFDDMNAGKALSNLIKLLRKHGCHLIVIGHTGKDIPKDIRRMVLFALKESKAKAVVGAGLEEDNAGWMQIKNVLMRFKSIKQTAIEYDSLGDRGTFTFDEEPDVEPGDERERCLAGRNKGGQCPNPAVRPEDDPQVCVNHTVDDIPEDADWLDGDSPSN